jgi:hypothetical protein
VTATAVATATTHVTAAAESTGVSAREAASMTAAIGATGASAVGRMGATVAAISRPSYATVTWATAISIASPAIAAVAVSAATVAESSSVAISVTTAPTPSIPRAYAEEYAASEPTRAVVAIGRATVGVVVVIAVITNRRTISIGNRRNHRANPYTDEDACLSLGRESQGNCQQRCKENQAKMPHF